MLSQFQEMGRSSVNPEVVEAILKTNVFVVLPTGFGKSACYQCLPLLHKKLYPCSDSAIIIGVNRPDLGGTVPLFGALSRCPALTHLCPAFFLHSPAPYKSTCFDCRVVSQARTIT